MTLQPANYITNTQETSSNDGVLVEFLKDISSLEYRIESQEQRKLTSPETLKVIEPGQSTYRLDAGTIKIDDLVARFSQRGPQPTPQRRTATLSPIAEWEGYVEEIVGDRFFVKLVNIKEGTDLPEDEAEFDLRDLPGDDQRTLEVGAIVRWVIGFERLANDMRQKVSRLHVRRLPAHSKREIQAALEEAKAFNASVNWDDAS